LKQSKSISAYFMVKIYAVSNGNSSPDAETVHVDLTQNLTGHLSDFATIALGKLGKEELRMS